MNTKSTALDEWIQARQGNRLDAPGLAGIKGRLLLAVAGKPVASLIVDDGHAELVRDTAPADATMSFIDAESLADVVSGRLNPVVASLQGRLRSDGDLIFATKAALGLQVDKPFGAPEPEREGEHAD